MKIVLILMCTIAVSSSAILFPYEMNDYKVSNDQTSRLSIIKDYNGKANLFKSSDNEEDRLKPRNVIKIEDFGIHNAFRISRDNDAVTIKPFQNETINNQEKVQPKMLRNKFNFYAKRIYKINKNNEKNESEESKIRNIEIASPVKFTENTKYSTEEKQDRKEFIFMINKNIAKNKRRKRSSNIIEEENLFTTVSTLKYTGRNARLTNDLYFKNINH